MWTKSTVLQTKAEITALHILTHAGLRLQSKQRPCTMHAGLSAFQKTPDKNGETKGTYKCKVHHPHPVQGRTDVRLALVHTQGIKKKSINQCNKKVIQVFTQKMIRGLFYKSPTFCLEEYILFFNEHLHHLSLIADVIQRCYGVRVGCTHEGGPENDGKVFCVHQVEFLILCHPATFIKVRRILHTPSQRNSFSNRMQR